MMNGKVCMVTGASDGIGKAAAMGLADRNANLVIVCRHLDKGNAAKEEIIEKTGNRKIDLLIADFSSFSEIRELAEEFKSKYDRLHVLLNNAGAFFSELTYSSDKIEMQFQVNHLAPFLLTNLLIDVMKKSAPARIVNVSSDSHYRGDINFEDLYFKNSYAGRRAYAQSKLANVLFTYELDRRLNGNDVTVNSLHPGVIKTSIAQKHAGAFYKIAWGIGKPFMASVDKGAETPLHLATSEEMEHVSGKYFEKKKAKPSSKKSYDEQLAARLWEISETLTGLKS